MSDEQTTKLVDLALDVLDDELECWRRVGTLVPQTTRLIRYPRMPDEFPLTDSSIEEAGKQEVQYLDVPDKEVNSILRRIAMEKVVKALAKEILI